MKKSMLFAAAAVVAMVGCTNEDFTGFQQSQNGEVAINFGSVGKTVTRAEKTGAEAATALNNNFVVYGFKSTDGLDAATFTSEVSPVFDHYSVNYGTGTAYSTESNTENWEYVGQVMSGLQSDAVKAQTIKYWDFAATQYNFVAFSKGANTETYPALFSKVDNTKLGTSDAAYTITGTVAQLQKCYVADLLTVKQTDFATGAVTPKFRKMGSKIRFGIYETVPGYSVKEVEFYTEETAVGSLSSATLAAKPTLFTKGGAGFPDPAAEGKMEVSFPTVGTAGNPSTDINKAHIKFNKTSSTADVPTLTFTNDLTYTAAAEQYEAEGDYIGRSSTTASYPGATPEAAYLDVLPTDAGQNIELQVNYTLVSTDGSGEEIKVYGATAIVPSIYTEWQPNYAYTYLFKISDKTNGYSNPDDQPTMAGLYPITFDAIVMGDEDGIQETITEIGSTPITTYQKGKIVTANNEYESGASIYVVVDDASKVLNTTANTVNCVALYTAIATDAIQGVTEASVENCFINGTYSSTNKNYTVKDIKNGTLVLTEATNLTLVNEIPATAAPHGVAIPTGDETNKKAAEITSPVASTYYVFQYQNKAATWKAASDKTLKKGETYYTTKDFGTEGVLVTSFESTGKEEIIASTYYKANPYVACATGDVIAASADYYVLIGGKYVKKTNGSTAYTVTASDQYYIANASATYATDADATMKTGSVYYSAENLQSRKVADGTEAVSGCKVFDVAPEFTYKVIKVQ